MAPQCRNLIFGNMIVGVELADLVLQKLSEPNVAVRPGHDAKWSAVPGRNSDAYEIIGMCLPARRRHAERLRRGTRRRLYDPVPGARRGENGRRNRDETKLAHSLLLRRLTKHA